MPWTPCGNHEAGFTTLQQPQISTAQMRLKHPPYRSRYLCGQKSAPLCVISCGSRTWNSSLSGEASLVTLGGCKDAGPECTWIFRENWASPRRRCFSESSVII
eukprot:784886-Prorocentrum_minimum.AAC.2